MQQRSKRPELKSKWKNQLDESDPAYMWAQCMAPTYGINILGTRSGLSFRVGSPHPLPPHESEVMTVLEKREVHRCRTQITEVLGAHAHDRILGVHQ